MMLASFSHPIELNTDPQLMLWVIPLIVLMAIVYKTVKIQKPSPANFAKEVVLLFGSIMAVLILISAGLWITVAIFT